MALTRPILNQVPAWDVAKGYAFTFDVIGGDQVVGSVLTIKNNVDGSVVYTHTETSYNFINTVPADASGLENGGYYTATIKTINSVGDRSKESTPIQFYCYSTPQIEFTNIPSGNVISSSKFSFEATYSQAQGEPLNSYKFTLYNSEKIQIASSGTLYATNLPSLYQDKEILTQLEYVFDGLFDNKAYYVKIDGLTKNGIIVTTELIQIFIRFDVPSTFAELTATNVCNDGYVLVNSNVVIIDGRAYPEAIYIDNKKIDVSRDGSYLVFDKGYSIDEDFTAKAWFSNANVGKIIEFNGDGNIKIGYLRDKEDTTKFMCKLIVNDFYVIYSNSVSATSTDDLCLQIRKSGNLYDLILSRLSEVDDEYFVTSDHENFVVKNEKYFIVRG